MTDAFCACASDVCAQKTLYQKFKPIWFKTHDFSTINMIIKTKTDVISQARFLPAINRGADRYPGWAVVVGGWVGGLWW